MTKVGMCRVSSVFITIVFTLSVLGYSQYCFSIEQKLKYPGHLSCIMIYVIPLSLLLSYALLLSTYILCIIIKPRKIPEQYNLSTAEIAQLMSQPDSQSSFQALAKLTREFINTRTDIQVRERDYRHGGLRVCEICSIIKPDRSHHCNICKRCIMRMDHHCQWVDNCIHEDNHKYFLQTITLGIVISILTILHFAINIIWAGKCKHASCIMMYVAVVLSGVVSIFLSFLTLDHCCNLFRGQTSYERVYGKDHYSRGWKKNFMDIMGQSICQWICPIRAIRLSVEHEPLICTVEEPSSLSLAWLTTPGNRASNDIPEEETEHCPPSFTISSTSHSAYSSRQNSGDSARERSATVDIYVDNNEETLSLACQAELGVIRGVVTRVRTPSVLPEDER